MSGSWERELNAFFNAVYYQSKSSLIALVDMLAIEAALWSHDCLNMQQALELDMSSEFLQCIPEAVRKKSLPEIRYPEEQEGE
jgi:hypothetical protein